MPGDVTGLLTHCAAYLDSPLLLEPLLDRFMEESPEFEPAARDYYATMLGDVTGKPNAIDLLVNETPHTATTRRVSRYGPWRDGRWEWEELSLVLVEPVNRHTWGVDSRPPTFCADQAEGPRLRWHVVRYTPVKGSHGGPPHFRRNKPQAVTTDQVVKELREAGGLGNVLHAALGVHYFAVPPYETAYKRKERKGD